MLLPIEINAPTLVVLALISAWAVWAVRRIVGRGLCDCNDHCGDAACGHGGCSGCSTAEKMVADMGKAACSSKGSCPHRA